MLPRLDAQGRGTVRTPSARHVIGTGFQSKVYSFTIINCFGSFSVYLR